MFSCGESYAAPANGHGHWMDFSVFPSAVTYISDMFVTVISVVVFSLKFKIEMMQDSTSFYPAWTAPIVYVARGTQAYFALAAEASLYNAH